ncbi:hypothetical protein ACFOY4_09825 [Actinomadura syzygii]|uniref:Uncharacterized protein n=1 Tax=Actinomadura syzygii TaxID=1427538 RepID=A0A5D0UE71_9ACTN|nr:hypothetical protein [Actinomadura syzygii]TYC15883.1 hypothetical protein FXF65_11115 [Actinomadura syzygii]
MTEGAFCATVLGAPKAGASTLVNALAGARTLPAPVSTRPGVPVAVSFVRGEGDAVLVLPPEMAELVRRRMGELGDGPAGRIASRFLAPSLDEFVPVVGTSPVHSVLADLRSLLGGRSADSPMPVASLSVPAAWSPGVVTCLDGPYEAVAELPCTGCLIVLDYAHLGTNEEAAMLRHAANVVKQVGADRVAIVVNRIDLWTPLDAETESERVTEYVSHVDVTFPISGIPVLTTSARWGLAGAAYLNNGTGADTLELLYPSNGTPRAATELSLVANELWTASGVGALRDEILLPWSLTVADGVSG